MHNQTHAMRTNVLSDSLLYGIAWGHPDKTRVIPAVLVPLSLLPEPDLGEQMWVWVNQQITSGLDWVSRYDPWVASRHGLRPGDPGQRPQPADN